MIKLTEPLIDITMKINLDLPQSGILEFLKRKGYEIRAHRQYLPAVEEMLLSEPELVKWTFTATREGEKPSDETIYLKVFEREIKSLLKDFMKM